MICTEIHYLYRDASNYKFRGSFVVGGKLAIGDLEPFLFGGEWFVPSEVGLPHLLDMPPIQDDHLMHEFEELEINESGDPICASNELIRRFELASERGWFSISSKYGFG